MLAKVQIIGGMLLLFQAALVAGRGMDSLSPGISAREGLPAPESRGHQKPARASAPSGAGNISPPQPDNGSGPLLSNRLFASTGLGIAQLKKDSDDWRAGGFGELQLSFDSGFAILGMQVLATIRYLPLDVSPNISQGGFRQEYTGVVEFWLLGAELRTASEANVQLVISTELGLSLVHLVDQVEFDAGDQMDHSGMAFAVGGGVDFAVQDKITAGPRLQIGFGSFSRIQLGAHLTFAF